MHHPPRKRISRLHFVLVCAALALTVAAYSPLAAGQNPIFEDAVLPNSGGPGNNAGSAVAVWGDVAIVGAQDEDDLGNYSGSAYIFRYDPGSGTWSEEQELHASDGAAGDHFGKSVALYEDVAIVGAPYHDDLYSSTGAVYIFRYDPGSGTWIQEEKIVAADQSPSDCFGWAVAIHGDVVLVGMPNDYVSFVHGGTAHFYRHNAGSGNWDHEDSVQAQYPEDGADFGKAVALYGDTALIGSPYEDGPGNDSGAAFFFSYNSSTQTWTQDAKCQASDAASGDQFGYSVSLHGGVALVGAHKVDGPGGFDTGAAYVYYDIGYWYEALKFTDPDGDDYDYFGESVSIYDNKAVIGAAGKQLSSQKSGTAFVYYYFDTTENWAEQYQLRSSATYCTALGQSVSIHEERIVAGVYEEALVYDSLEADPIYLDVDCNGDDGPLTLSQWDIADLTIALHPGDSLGVRHDWWIAAWKQGGNVYSWIYGPNPYWRQGRRRTYVGPLIALKSYTFHYGFIPIGTWEIEFTLDDDDNTYQGTHTDSIEISVTT